MARTVSRRFRANDGTCDVYRRLNAPESEILGVAYHAPSFRMHEPYRSSATIRCSRVPGCGWARSSVRRG